MMLHSIIHNESRGIRKGVSLSFEKWQKKEENKKK
jgi:hypothetical protein